MKNDSFISELRVFAQAHPLFQKSHPFWRDCFRGSQSVERVQRWTMDVHPFIRDFPLFYLHVAAKGTQGPALTHVCETIYEETGSGNPAASHLMLFERFMGAIKTPLPAAEAAASPSARAICEYTWDIVRRSSFMEGLALLGLGVERPLTRLFPLAARAFERRYGLSASAVEFFSTHGVADFKHSQTAARIVGSLAVTPEDQARVREILQGLWDRQQRHLDSLCSG
ncbi:MAG: iron-containing redox enzyme family protein [Verrucomicrobia bacterium]|nr:iron-containing redox enzyme family protein [Verrucomicrobiota bacterium]